MSRSNKFLVAAIDIGTTHSCCGFSFKSEYEADPLRINSFNWSADFGLLRKTSTCILFNKKKQFDSFGYEAEDKYSELAEMEEHQEWYFIKNFKTTLFNTKEQLSKAVTLYTADGRTMLAIDVFSAAIKYLRGHLLDTLEKQGTGMGEREIQWVLTVPDIWDDAAKQFMRESADKAGICGDQLLMVSEPEAVILYCMQEETRMNRSNCFSVGAGTKCMVVIAEIASLEPDSLLLRRNFFDAGEVTEDRNTSQYGFYNIDVGVEIAVYDVQPRGILKKLYSTYNFDWDKNKVKASFCSLLTDIVGDDVMKAFLSECEDDFHKFLTNFEIRKFKQISPKLTGKFTLDIPSTLKETFTEMNPESDINEMIASKPKYNERVIFVANKMQIDVEIAKALFDESCSKIIYHMQELFLYPTLKDVSSILLVGSYAMSPMLQFAVREAFKYPQREVFVPRDAETTALKGAVIYGHQQIFS